MVSGNYPKFNVAKPDRCRNTAKARSVPERLLWPLPPPKRAAAEDSEPRPSHPGFALLAVHMEDVQTTRWIGLALAAIMFACFTLSAIAIQ